MCRRSRTWKSGSLRPTAKPGARTITPQLLGYGHSAHACMECRIQACLYSARDVSRPIFRSRLFPPWACMNYTVVLQPCLSKTAIFRAKLFVSVTSTETDTEVNEVPFTVVGLSLINVRPGLFELSIGGMLVYVCSYVSGYNKLLCTNRG